MSHSNAAANAAPTLTHPTIQYQFRDDPPLSLPDSQHVLVMDYDPAVPDDVRVQSLSHQLAVTAVRVTDAPGAGQQTRRCRVRNGGTPVSIII